MTLAWTWNPLALAVAPVAVPPAPPVLPGPKACPPLRPLSMVYALLSPPVADAAVAVALAPDTDAPAPPLPGLWAK